MKIRSAIVIAWLATSGTAIAEEYQSFTYLEYTTIDLDIVEVDLWLLGTSYFLSDRSTLGPLDQFTYINPISNFGAAYADVDGNNQFVVGGEYFFDKIVVGAAASDDDGIEQVWVGYLFSENFLASVEAVDEFDETEFYFAARYQLKLEGNDYLGFSVRSDDGLDNLSFSSKYFRGLSNGRYLSIDASILDVTGGNFAAVDASYYWTERTSARAGLRTGGNVALGFKHFFNRSFLLEVDYEDMGGDGDSVSLILGAQF